MAFKGLGFHVSVTYGSGFVGVFTASPIGPEHLVALLDAGIDIGVCRQSYRLGFIGARMQGAHNR